MCEMDMRKRGRGRGNGGRRLVDPSGPLGPDVITGLKGYWKFENNLTDSSGTGNDLTNGGVSYGTGKIGQGVVSGIATKSSLTGSVDGDFTLSFWCFPTGGVFGGGKIGWTSDTAFPSVIISQDDTPPTVSVQGTGIVSAGPLTDSTWNHVAVSNSSGTLSLYVNGTLVTTDAITPGGMNTSFEVNTDISFTTPVPIDELGVYMRGLTAAQISYLYNSGAARRPSTV